MDQALVAEAKKQLEAKKEKVLQQLGGIGKKDDKSSENYNASFPEYGRSDEDNATEIADYTTNLSLEKELEGELAKINRALEKIEDGSYGNCDNCQNPIDPERLKIMSEAVVCMSCKK